MVKLLPSSDDYQEINALSQMLCWLKNPHILCNFYDEAAAFDESTGDMIYGTEKIVPDMTEAEINQAILVIEDSLRQSLEFAEFGYAAQITGIFAKKR